MRRIDQLAVFKVQGHEEAFPLSRFSFEIKSNYSLSDYNFVLQVDFIYLDAEIFLPYLEKETEIAIYLADASYTFYEALLLRYEESSATFKARDAKYQRLLDTMPENKNLHFKDNYSLSKILLDQSPLT